jgi:hypothetical protein
MLATYLPFGVSAAIASVAGIGVTLGVAMGFERLVDGPAIRLSRMVGRIVPNTVRSVGDVAVVH